ncbi:MAG TPA: hypothetical protein PKY77_20320 [Phycisphaerae bacterium]|nr:hypothetical protein [Phycisphaerae bacterium]HRY71033.1 hypothetical protein [Phycisphaerae bacterium]HSA29355.1 hypothetical protein [Phycisphaerae bacterium]
MPKWSLWLVFSVIATVGAGWQTVLAKVGEAVNLADFARVVKYLGDSPETLQVRELEQGSEGWEPWRGDDNEYMIGLEWDEPRDVCLVEIEFRHAISDRDKIRVQYFQDHWPSAETGGWAGVDDPFHGKWVTAKADWWAGDRDVTFAFLPYDQEQPGDGAPDVIYRRTYRLRFLLGKREIELPAVRYFRVYGPRKTLSAKFNIRFEPRGKLRLPLDVSVVNGGIIDRLVGDTTIQSWVLNREPTSLEVNYLEDLETPSRTVVTLRSPEDPLVGMSFLPAEVVKHGIMRVPSMGMVIAHVGGRQALQAGTRTGASVFDRVATEPEQTWERARREIPELQKSRQVHLPLHLPLGPPDARQEIAVSYDGSILLSKSALKVPAADSDRVHFPADEWYIRVDTGTRAFDRTTEGNVKQRLMDGYLPIVVNSWAHEGVKYEETSVATFLDGEPREIRGDETVVLVTRLTMTNPGSGPATATVMLSSDPGEQLILESGHVSARAAIRDKKASVYRRPPYRYHVRSSAEVIRIESRGSDGEEAIAWQGQLAAGQSAALEWFVPFVAIDTDAERRAIAGLDFDKVLKSESERWQAIIARQATIEVPDPLLNDFYKAQLAHILITADRDPYAGFRVLPAATLSYNVCMNESCHQIRALEVRGLHEHARQYLDAFLTGQSTRGLHGRFSDKHGVIHGLPSKNGNYQTFNYNLDHGFALWMLNEHYRFTRDKGWLSAAADQLVAACDFVTRQSRLPAESNTLGKDDARWGEGLLPPGHLEDPPEWLWWFAVNAYAARGMRMTAESLAEIHAPEAARIAREATTFSKHLEESCREAMVQAPVVRLRDGTYVPFQPTRSRLRGRDLGWIRDALYGPVHLIDCGVFAPDSPEAEWILRDTEDNVFIGEERGRGLDDFERRWFSWGGITIQSNLLPNPLVYLQRGQGKHAVRTFYNSLAANVYADVRAFTEHPVAAYGLGRGPNYKTPDESAFIVWLRSLLVLERGQELDLLAGVPQEWLGPGKKITIRGAATWFGPLDLEAEAAADARQLSVKLSSPSRNPPKAIRLHTRLPGKVAAVTLNGAALSTFDAQSGIVTLPGNVGRAEIIIAY